MNHIHLKKLRKILQECPAVTGEDILRRFASVLEDESRLRADSVETVYQPRSIEELVSAVNALAMDGKSCVFSAGRTGIAGGAVPIEADSVVMMTEMNRLLGIGCHDGQYYVRAEPGLVLADLYGALENLGRIECYAPTTDEQVVFEELKATPDTKLWFPVNPTEATAHIGGIVATNASGARTYRYGAVRDWVRALTVVLADGSLLCMRRGEVVAENGRFIFEHEDGSERVLDISEIPWPTTKATLGYPLSRTMDLIDLFIGSEGTLGAVVEIELALAIRPEFMMGVMVVLESEQQVCELVDKSRKDTRVTFDAIEYFDKNALRLLQRKKAQAGRASLLPNLHCWQGFALYFEISGNEDQVMQDCKIVLELIEAVGGNPENTWAASYHDEVKMQRVFRHSVPEEVNAIIGQRKVAHPGLHKVGTDMAVPNDKLGEVFDMYRRGLAAVGLEAVIFGHIGDNHVHVNMLPKDVHELRRAKELYQQWAAEVVAMGGAVAAEHGIGRMKKSMLAIQCSGEDFAAMEEVRRFFDPERTFSPGVLF